MGFSQALSEAAISRVNRGNRRDTAHPNALLAEALESLLEAGRDGEEGRMGGAGGAGGNAQALSTTSSPIHVSTTANYAALPGNCGICWDTLPATAPHADAGGTEGGAGVTMPGGCQHTFCRGCVAGWLQSAITEGKVLFPAVFSNHVAK